MSIAKRTTRLSRFDPVRAAWAYQNVPRPVSAMAIDFPDRYHIPRHKHQRAQLMYAARGVVTCSTAAGTWVLPSLRALWIPAKLPHWTRKQGASEMRTLYIDPKAVPHLPDECGVVDVSPLLRELIVEAVRIPRLYKIGSRDDRLMQLLLGEIRVTSVPALHLPMPTDARLASVCNAILKHPAANDSLEEWAAKLAISSKTLARLFVRQTGTTFGRWRQQARLLASLPLLANGEPVQNVALDLGYGTQSAFTAMFRKALGVTPSKYFQRETEQHTV